MPQRRLPTPVRRWLRSQVKASRARHRPKVGALVYCVAAALLLAAAAGTGVAIRHAQRSVAQVKRMHEVPWVGGEVTIREPGTFALYRVQPGYAGMPRTRMPSMWIYGPNGLPLQITYTPSKETTGDAKAVPASAAPDGREETEVPVSSRSIKVGDITAEQIGTVDIGAPGTYEVRFTAPMRVGDALLVSPPVDQYVPPLVTSLKLAAGFEALGLVLLLWALFRHLLRNRGTTLSGLVLSGAHRVAAGEQRTFEEVADTFGAPATQARRRHRSRHHTRPSTRPVIDLRAPRRRASLDTPLPPPPASAAPAATVPPATEVAPAATLPPPPLGGAPLPPPPASAARAAARRSPGAVAAARTSAAPTGPAARRRAAAPGPVPPAPRPVARRTAPAGPPRPPQVRPDDALGGFPTPRPNGSDLPSRSPRRRVRAIPAAHVSRPTGLDGFDPMPAGSRWRDPFAPSTVSRSGRAAPGGFDHDLDLELDLRTGTPTRPVGAAVGAGEPSAAARSRVVRVPRPRLDRTR